MPAPIFSIDWYRCTYAHRAATYDFWEYGLTEWLETWRMAS